MLLALGCALGGLGLAGCSSISEKVSHAAADAPGIGLPAGVPERPVTRSAYPAVHDVPPARPAVLSSDQQIKMEDDLVAARNQQQTLVGLPASPPPASYAPAATKKPAPAAIAARKKSRRAAKAAAAKDQTAPPAAPATPSSSTRSIY